MSGMLLRVRLAVAIRQDRLGAENLRRLAEDLQNDPLAAGEARRMAADLDRLASITEAALGRASGVPVDLRPPGKRPPDRG